MVKGSSLWNHAWASFDDIREQLEWQGPTTRAEVLALPLVHHSRHWQEGAVQLFRRPGCVARLWHNRIRCFGDCWVAEEERWLSLEELQDRGLPSQLAVEVGNALASLISPVLSQAMGQSTQLGIGDWVADVDLSATEFRLDSTLCVQESSEDTLEGPEFVVDEQSWQLSRFAEEDHTENMAFPREISCGITVLFGKGK